MQGKLDGVEIDLYAEDIEQDQDLSNEGANDSDVLDLFDDALTTKDLENLGKRDEEEQGGRDGAGESTSSSSTPTANNTGSGPGNKQTLTKPSAPAVKKHQVLIGNLTWWTTDENIKEVLKGCGVEDFIDVKFYENRANGQSKGYCVVAVGSEASVRLIHDIVPKTEVHGRNPVVTPPTKQSLAQFESGSKSRPPSQGNHPGGMYNYNHGPGPHPGHPGNMMMGGPGPRGQMTSPVGMGYGPCPGPRMMVIGTGPQGQMRCRGPPMNMTPGMSPHQRHMGHEHRPGGNYPPPQRPHPLHHPSSGPPPHHIHSPRGPPPSHPHGMSMNMMMPGPGGGHPMSPNMNMRGHPQREWIPPGNVTYPNIPCGNGPRSGNGGPHGIPPNGVRPGGCLGMLSSGPGPGPQGMHGPAGVGFPGGIAPAPHVNPAFFTPLPTPNGPNGNNAPAQAQPRHATGTGTGSPSCSSSSSTHQRTDYSNNTPASPPGPAPLPPALGKEGRLVSQMTEAEFEEALSRNRTVTSSAISRAVADAAAGEFASAIETLVTAISLIKQSRVAQDDRCKILVSSLQDTFNGIESKTKSHRRDRSRSRDRDRRRRRERSRSRDRYYRERSRERERYERSRSPRERDTRYYDRERERERYHRERDRERDLRERDREERSRMEGDRDRERERDREADRRSRDCERELPDKTEIQRATRH